MIIIIDKNLKIKMLKALKEGIINTENFKEFQDPQITVFEIPDNGRN